MLTINEVLTRGVVEILPNKKGLIDMMTRKKITLYQGFDPSIPSLHLGHLTGLIKLMQFQKLGHKVIFLVGDFTGMIGDPTDKLSTRPKLTHAQVMKNCQIWKEQASRVLDFSGKNKADIRFNHDWLNKLTPAEIVEICSKFTHQQLIERDMFQKRIRENKPIFIHEILYPIFQGYDSVAMNVDLEVGGNDQLFNMLAGRTLMKAVKSKEKFVLATKLLIDNEGNKVGKTIGNALFLDSNPEQFYAGIMSFPDKIIGLGFELLTEVPLEGITEKIKKDPMEEKKKLAFEVVKLLWGEKSAKESQERFEKTFQEKAPEYKEKIKIKGNLAYTIAQISSVGSVSQAKRLIRDSAVEVNGKVINEVNYRLKGNEKIKVGKRIFIITYAAD
jgi:tyrosyl-tRNA synthetase